MWRDQTYEGSMHISAQLVQGSSPCMQTSVESEHLCHGWWQTSCYSMRYVPWGVVWLGSNSYGLPLQTNHLFGFLLCLYTTSRISTDIVSTPIIRESKWIICDDQTKALRQIEMIRVWLCHTNPIQPFLHNSISCFIIITIPPCIVQVCSHTVFGTYHDSTWNSIKSHAIKYPLRHLIPHLPFWMTTLNIEWF